jgi:alkaline phosphatase D
MLAGSALAPAILPAVRLPVAPPVARGLLLGPASGDVGARSAVLWGRSDGPGALFFRVSTSTDLERGLDLAASSSPDSGFAASVPVGGLQPGTRYYYAATAGAERDDPSRTLDQALDAGILPATLGTFRTAPAEADAAEAVFTWGGDLAAQFRPFTIFDTLHRERPDFHLLLGDTIYADQVWVATSLEDYRRKYSENGSDPSLRTFARGTPWWTIWDDHEGTNDFDSTWPGLATARRAFQEAWPITRQPDDVTRLYRSFRWGSVAEFFILDTRQYRSPDGMDDGPAKTLLGREQMRWLREGLRSSTASLKFVVSSVPVRHASRDCWSGFAFERDRFVRFVAESHLSGLVILSGTCTTARWSSIRRVSRRSPSARWPRSRSTIGISRAVMGCAIRTTTGRATARPCSAPRAAAPRCCSRCATRPGSRCSRPAWRSEEVRA